MLTKEAKYWWTNARQRFQAAGTVVTWVVFVATFLEKHFPDVIKKRLNF